MKFSTLILKKKFSMRLGPPLHQSISCQTIPNFVKMSCICYTYTYVRYADNIMSISASLLGSFGFSSYSVL